MAFDGYADFEEGDTTDFDAETDADGDLNAAIAAAHDGTYGAEITFDDGNAAYGTLNMDAVDQVTAVASFWLDPNSFTPQNSKRVMICDGNSGAPQRQLSLDLWYTGTAWQLRSGVRTDTGYSYSSNYFTIPGTNDDWHHIVLLWAASTGAGSDDGYFRIYVDGTEMSDLAITNVDNDTKDIDNFNFGMLYTDATTYGGSYYMDEIRIDPTEAYWWYPVAGTVTPTGAVVKGSGKPLTGTVTPAGALARVVAWYRSLAGTVTPAGTVIKGLAEAMSGVLTPTGTIIKGIGKALVGTITPAGRLLQRIANFFRIWFDASPETVARIDITATADIQLDDSPETTVILEQ